MGETAVIERVSRERRRRAPLIKRPDAWLVRPNLRDYALDWAMFSWKEARQRLDGLPGGRGLNLAHEAVDRHTAALHGGRVAIRWIGRTGARRDLTYDDLRAETNRFANSLRHLGLAKGDVVSTLTGRIPALYVAALGTMKNGSIQPPTRAKGTTVA